MFEQLYLFCENGIFCKQLVDLLQKLVVESFRAYHLFP